MVLPFSLYSFIFFLFSCVCCACMCACVFACVYVCMNMWNLLTKYTHEREIEIGGMYLTALFAFVL